MRIALVASQVAPIREPQIGGAQVVVVDLARGLAARGHDVAVLAPRGSAIDGVTVVDTGVDPDELADDVQHPGAVNAPSRALTHAFSRVMATVAEGDWDCVHNHAFDAPAIDQARALACPVVHTLHLPPEPHVAASLAAAVADTDARRPLIVAVSAASGRSWHPFVRVDAIVPNGVPTGSIPWSAEAGAGLLFVGRLSPEKGADVAVEVARRAGMRLTLAGAPYDATWAATLLEAVDPELVDVTGPIPRADVWRLMRGAAALVAPSRWEEPFGLCVAEAQAAGTPALVWRRGGLPELVLDGVTGWAVENADDGVDRAGRASLLDRTACRRHAETALDVAAMVDGYERLYAAVAGARVR